MSESFKLNKEGEENLNNLVERQEVAQERTWAEKLMKSINVKSALAGLVFVSATAMPPAEAKEPLYGGVKTAEISPKTKKLFYSL